MGDRVLNLNEAIEYIQGAVSRGITQIHDHNTYSPSHKDFTGSNHLQLQAAMRSYHVKTNGWQDIGQHFTIMPDGMIVTGRSLELDPASIQGWNSGAICIEMLGDFSGRDPFQGAQAESAFRFNAALVKRFGLPWDAVKFHRDNPNAGNPTCPGTSIDKSWFIAESQARYKWMYPPEPEPITDPEKWKLDGIKVLYDAGLLTDYDGWAKKKDDPAPVSLVTTVLARMYEKLKG